MTDFARLGFMVDSKQAVDAAKDLNQLSGAAKEAQTATEKLSIANGKLKSTQQAVSAATQRIAQSDQRLTLLRSNLVTLQNTAGVSAERLAAAQLNVANAEATLVGRTNALTAAKHRLAAAETMVANANGIAQAAQNRVNLGQINSTKVVQQLTRDNRVLAFQLNDVAVSLASGMNPMMVAIQQGSQISQLYAGQGGVAMAFRQTGLMAMSAAGYIGRFAAANPIALASTVALGLGLRSVVNDLQAAGYASIGYGDVFVAAIQVAASGIQSALQPAIDWIAPYISSGLNTAGGYFKSFANFVIGIGVGTFAAFSAAWNDLPGFFGDLGARAGWALGEGIKKALNAAILMLREKITSLNATFGTSFQAPSTFLYSAAPKAKSNVTGGAIEAFQGAMGRDYIGELGNAIKAKAISNSLAEVEKAAGGAGNALKKAATEAKDPWDKLRAISPAITDNLNKIRDAGNQLGTSLGGVFAGLTNKTMTWQEAAVSAFKSVLSYLNQMNVAGGGAGLFGGGFFQSLIGGFLGIPGFANGTNYAPGGAAIVGERGPELVNLPRGSQVIPNNRMNAANSNQVVAVHVTVGVDDKGAIQAYVNKQTQQMGQQAVKQSVETSRGSFGAWSQQYRTNGGYA